MSGDEAVRLTEEQVYSIRRMAKIEPLDERVNGLLYVVRRIAAARDAEVAARALRDAADAADGEALPHPNIDGDWLDGACDVIEWLRERAARVQGGEEC